MNLNEYQKLAARTIPATDPDDQLHHGLFGLASEAGEVLGIYQKVYQGHEMDNEHLQKEVGDLLWFIAEFCTSTGWNLDDIMQMNIDKLKARFPKGFEIDKSLHRKEGDI
mgnify:CR=1 FL=1